MNFKKQKKKKNNFFLLEQFIIAYQTEPDLRVNQKPSAHQFIGSP
jgi:hypothetical protein